MVLVDVAVRATPTVHADCIRQKTMIGAVKLVSWLLAISFKPIRATPLPPPNPYLPPRPDPRRQLRAHRESFSACPQKCPRWRLTRRRQCTPLLPLHRVPCPVFSLPRSYLMTISSRPRNSTWQSNMSRSRPRSSRQFLYRTLSRRHRHRRRLFMQRPKLAKPLIGFPSLRTLSRIVRARPKPS